jgi:hypothetical protein
MNIPENRPKPARSRPWLWILLGTTLVCALVCAWLAIKVVGLFYVSRDARALRDGAMQSVAGEWNKEIEVSIGSLTVNLARAGLSFVDLPPEARMALKSLRGAEVGIYRLRKGGQVVNPAVMLSGTDKAMGRRGWERLVGVLNRTEMVAIYVPRKISSARDVKVCVAVMDKEQLVIAAARSNLEPLVELAARQANWCPKARGPGQLSAVSPLDLSPQKR